MDGLTDNLGCLNTKAKSHRSNPDPALTGSQFTPARVESPEWQTYLPEAKAKLPFDAAKRNPKTEDRNPKEVRKPNSESVNPGRRAGLASVLKIAARATRPYRSATRQPEDWGEVADNVRPSWLKAPSPFRPASRRAALASGLCYPKSNFKTGS